MRESVLFSGMFRVLAYILIIVELHAAIPDVYRPIISSGDITNGWHRARENHYKLERRLVIGQNHPYNQYSNMQMYWPVERWPYGRQMTTGDRITSFQCINRTPSTAKALMHVIHGGIGSPELVVDVRYAPVRFMLLNLMIITCHVNTEASDMGTKEEHLFWNPFNVDKSNMQIEPVTDQRNPPIPSPFPSSFGTIHLKETTSPVDIKPTIETLIRNASKVTAGFYNEGISKGTNKTTVQLIRTGQKTDRETVLTAREGKGKSEINICINGRCMKIKGDVPQSTKTRTFQSHAEAVGLETGNMTLEVTGDKSFHKTIKCPRLGRITLRIENEVSGTEKIIEILCGGTSENTFETIGTSPPILGEYSTDDQASRTTSRSVTTSPSTTRTTWGAARSKMKTTSPSINAQTTQTEKPIEIESGTTSSGTDEENYNPIGKRVSDEQDKNSNIKSIEKVTKPLTYNLLVKVVPAGSKRKIGLAKITY